MLQVFSASWCPHCQKAIRWLRDNDIPFQVVNIETAETSLVEKVVAINGGEDWVVPTLEYEGKWRKGMVFEPQSFKQDLIELGMTVPDHD
ncbi:glutaredoxin family protein [Desulfobotulus sp. H1]|uniref:Glutaredoxin family protein n=1 Tax=Desulfobotulus pelophilus TaxID=2823377 RepID=A0ABT3NER9_9BACT|nr:glutaredoxin family protein [Desulfobotulus pelophilus]MCW7755387.1 glutaredoxin family protein [Desulfobotulus pelophilus]